MTRFTAFTLALLLTTPLLAEAPAVQVAELGQIPNVHVCGNVFTSGQPARDDLTTLQEKGIRRVISLRTDGEIDWDQSDQLKTAGIEFVRVPFRAPDSLTDDVFDQVRQLLGEDSPTLLHCGSANRVGAVWLTHRVLDQGIPLKKAVAEAKEIGLNSAAYEQRARSYIARRVEKQSVKPGINQNFLDSQLDVGQWLSRFEVESREVYSARSSVLEACEIKAGDRIADVGAGTGFYSRLFAEKTGPSGWVYAIDIAPQFMQHLSQRIQDENILNMTPLYGGERSIRLPPDSVDLVFICDTYHHFEFPYATLASIYQAVRPGGTLVLIDFERIPGQSRDWLLDHVRAGKDEFRNEVESIGFHFEGEKKIDGFKENYLLRFRK